LPKCSRVGVRREPFYNRDSLFYQRSGLVKISELSIYRDKYLNCAKQAAWIFRLLRHFQSLFAICDRFLQLPGMPGCICSPGISLNCLSPILLRKQAALRIPLSFSALSLVRGQGLLELALNNSLTVGGWGRLILRNRTTYPQKK